MLWHTSGAYLPLIDDFPSRSHVQLFVTPWTTAHQASVSFTVSWNLLKIMPIETIMPTVNHFFSATPIPNCLQSYPAFVSFLMIWLFASGGQNIATSASVLPMSSQCWFPLGLTPLICLQFKGLKSLLQHHSSKTSINWLSSFFMVQISHPCTTTGKNHTLIIWTFASKMMSLVAYVVWVGHSFSSKKQMSFNFMASVTMQWFWNSQK